jgi:hypothetical protein
MSSFLTAYERGEPVAVRRTGSDFFGIPCGFVIFPDGVAWADDGVLAADYASHHVTHHLFGELRLSERTIECQGHVFCPGPLGDQKYYSAWRSLKLSAEEWIALHRRVERRLRSQHLVDRHG